MSSKDNIIKQDFINRSYVYINQVFGDDNVRMKILELFNLPKGALMVDCVIDRDNSEWSHHLAIDLFKNNKRFCSVEEGQQEIYSDDTACQSYSIYNTLIINKDYILKNISPKHSKRVSFLKKLEPLEKCSRFKRYLKNGEINENRIDCVHRNTIKIATLLKWLLKQKSIITEINDLLFLRLKDENDNFIVSDGKGRYVDKIIPKLNKVLTDWEKYGYIYFV